MSVNTWGGVNTWEAGGVIDILPTLGLISYTSNDSIVSLSGSVDAVSTLGLINYSSSPVIVDLSGAVGVDATLGTISYNSINTTVTIELGQNIGVVTVSFKPDTITVTFKN